LLRPRVVLYDVKRGAAYINAGIRCDSVARVPSKGQIGAACGKRVERSIFGELVNERWRALKRVNMMVTRMAVPVSARTSLSSLLVY